VEGLETRNLLTGSGVAQPAIVSASGSNLSLATADSLALNTPVSGTVGSGSAEWFRLTTADDGTLTADLAADNSGTLTPRLELYGSAGQLLVESDGGPATNGSPTIDQHVQAGTYYLEVSAAVGAGGYLFSASYQPGTSPLDPLPSPPGYPTYPTSVAVGDFNGDGTLDLAVLSLIGGNTDHIQIWLGNGDGTFRPGGYYDAGGYAYLLMAKDVNRDGILDLITEDASGGSQNVLMGHGDGTFSAPQEAFDRYVSNTGGLFSTFADLTGNGTISRITTDNPDGLVHVYLGSGDTYQSYQAGADPRSVAVGDLTGNGIPDLVVANFGSDTFSVLMGNGDGTFQPARTYQAAGGPFALTLADLNHDGRLDVITANYYGGGASVYLGNGDGTFRTDATLLAQDEGGVVLADLNGDGNADMVTGSLGGAAITVRLGNGDGTFQAPQTYDLGGQLVSLSVEDVNGDGKPDLVAVVNTNQQVPNAIDVFLGNGDGTFQPARVVAQDASSSALALAHVFGGGHADLVQLDDGTVFASEARDDGTFQAARPVAPGIAFFTVPDTAPRGPGRPALITVTADYVSTFPGMPGYYANIRLEVLCTGPDDTLTATQTLSFPEVPSEVLVADVNGDGRPDLIAACPDGLVGVFLGNGDGAFQPLPTFTACAPPLDSLVVSDIDEDGKPDLVVLSGEGGGFPYTLTVLKGRGDGTFDTANPVAASVGSSASSLAVGDVNGDGLPDVVLVGGNTISVLLGAGDGTFRAIDASNAVGRRDTPFLADLTGDGIADTVVLDQSGDILFRGGLPGPDGGFAPPVVLNPGRPARDLAVVNTGAGWVVAAADRSFDPDLSSPGNLRYPVSIYSVAPDGAVTRTTAFTMAGPVERIAAGDLAGGGRDDLVVADAFADTATIALQNPDGRFAPTVTRSVGLSPSDITSTDVNGDGLPDVVVTDQASGDVFVLYNDPAHSFTATARFRADAGLAAIDSRSGRVEITSLSLPVALVAGDFTGDGRQDLVVVNRGAHSLVVLPSDGLGGYLDPQPALTASISDGPLINDRPGAVVAGAFGPGPQLDLAVLMEDSGEVWVYTNNGDGTFTHTSTILAGTSPTGLTLVPDGTPGRWDLLVGDPQGDVLRLVGDGQGSFAPPPPLAGDLTSLNVYQDGSRTQVLVADQQHDSVTVQAPAADGNQFAPVTTLAGGGSAVLAPGAVQWARLEGANSPYLDAVVVSSGGNEVLVYRGTGFDADGRPTFAAPVAYPVGTDPVALTIADVTGDGVPDLLVANHGSNDVSVLFGAIDGAGHWVATAGPRLKTGGVGPVSVAVRQQSSSGLPELVVTNGQSGSVGVLPGVGQGFFNDQHPQVLNLPGNPAVGAPVFVGTSGLGVAVTADGRLVGFNLSTFSALGTLFTPAPGQEVRAIEALDDGRLLAAEDGGGVAPRAIRRSAPWRRTTASRRRPAPWHCWSRRTACARSSAARAAISCTSSARSPPRAVRRRSCRRRSRCRPWWPAARRLKPPRRARRR
jgi:hypothetical protein